MYVDFTRAVLFEDPADFHYQVMGIADVHEKDSPAHRQILEVLIAAGEIAIERYNDMAMEDFDKVDPDLLHRAASCGEVVMNKGFTRDQRSRGKEIYHQAIEQLEVVEIALPSYVPPAALATRAKPDVPAR